MNDYCQHRLLVVGPASDLKAFDRDADWTETPGATDIVLQEHSPTRRVWQFVTEAPALKSLRVISRRWPHLTFFLHFDCEDARAIGLVRMKNGRVRHLTLSHGAQASEAGGVRFTGGPPTRSASF